jgi:hypothetical protein
MIIALAMAALMVSAYHRGMIYSHYVHVDNGGWERNDTMQFYIPCVKEAGV